MSTKSIILSILILGGLIYALSKTKSQADRTRCQFIKTQTTCSQNKCIQQHVFSLVEIDLFFLIDADPKTQFRPKINYRCEKYQVQTTPPNYTDLYACLYACLFMIGLGIINVLGFYLNYGF